MDIQYGQYVVPGPSEMVNFGVGQPSNSELPLDIVKKACLKINDLTDNSVLQYGDIPGYKQFRADFSKFLERNYEKEVNYKELFITNGVTGAISLISSLFISKCRKVYVEEPTYFLVINIFKEFGFEVESINLEDDGMNLNELEEKLSSNNDEVKLLYTIPTFHNPTSITMSDNKRKKLIEMSKSHNMYIIADEVYQLLYFDEKPPPPLYYYGGNVFSLSSFSKILAPSLRLGWIQCNSTLMKMLSSCGQLDSSGGINPFITRIVHNILNEGDLDEHVAKTRNILKSRCDKLISNLSLNFVKPTGGYFIWCKLPFKASEFLKFCENNRIKFHIGSKFSGDGKLDNYLRLSFSFYDLEGLSIGGQRISNLYNEYLEDELKEKIYIYGSTGKLGSKICELSETYGFKAIPLERDLSNLKNKKNTVIVDVTSVDGTFKLFSALLQEDINLPVIIGTTGDFSDNCKNLIFLYSKNNAIFKISNFSNGIPTILNMLDNVKSNDWNISIDETHHVHKKDKPSGTAKTLAKKLNVGINDIVSYRKKEIYGIHELNLESKNEKIKIVHEAKNRDIFAIGFFKYVNLIKFKDCGYYDSNFDNEFSRYSVCGNTFVVTEKYPTKVQKICNRFNVDGLIWYTIDINDYDFLWMYWNKDGSLVEMCANGSRCITYHFIKNHKCKFYKFINNFNIEQTFLKNESFSDNYVSVSTPEYSDYSELSDYKDCYFVRVGVPHVIRKLDLNHNDFYNFNLKDLYHDLNNKYEQYFKTRFNVSIIMNNDENIYIRTYEKGVEDETGACGSACIASIYNSSKDLNKLITKEGEILIKNVGFEKFISSEVNMF